MSSATAALLKIGIGVAAVAVIVTADVLGWTLTQLSAGLLGGLGGWLLKSPIGDAQP